MTAPNPLSVDRTRFMGVELILGPEVLVPRPETELLGRTAGAFLDGLTGVAEIRLIDMCCGAGNLVCALAKDRPGLRAWATDLTDGAITVAKANVTNLGLDERVTVAQGDLFQALAGKGLEGTIDVIVCNPPYISSGKLEKDSAELLEHEPREAFDGGPYGVSIFQRVIRDGRSFLKPAGMLFFEIGVGQARQVTALFDRARSYSQVEAYVDAAGEPRVMGAAKR